MIDKSQDSVKNEKLGTVENSDDAQGQEESKEIQNSAKQNSMKRYEQSSGSSASVIIEQRTY